MNRLSETVSPFLWEAIFFENFGLQDKKYTKKQLLRPIFVLFCSTFACVLGKNKRVIRHHSCTRVCHYYYQASLHSQWDDEMTILLHVNIY